MQIEKRLAFVAIISVHKKFEKLNKKATSGIFYNVTQSQG